ncbi:hypothetical protein HK098_001586 [Nowakowskiella sp. JEL0407]|nr:hypothetical protein HK098_001586 [Nowakowskiella sp. JEL0407]
MSAHKAPPEILAAEEEERQVRIKEHAEKHAHSEAQVFKDGLLKASDELYSEIHSATSIPIRQMVKEQEEDEREDREIISHYGVWPGPESGSARVEAQAFLYGLSAADVIPASAKDSLQNIRKDSSSTLTTEFEKVADKPVIGIVKREMAKAEEEKERDSRVDDVKSWIESETHAHLEARNFLEGVKNTEGGSKLMDSTKKMVETVEKEQGSDLNNQ